MAQLEFWYASVVVLEPTAAFESTWTVCRFRARRALRCIAASQGPPLSQSSRLRVDMSSGLFRAFTPSRTAPGSSSCSPPTTIS